MGDHGFAFVGLQRSGHGSVAFAERNAAVILYDAQGRQAVLSR